MGGYTITLRTKWCKSCGICVAFCPKQVLGVEDFGKVNVINPEACIGCRLCEFRCPDFAIDVGRDEIG